MGSRRVQHPSHRITGSRLGPCSYFQDRELGSPWSQTLASVVRSGFYWYPERWLRHPQSLLLLVHCIFMCVWLLLLDNVRIFITWYLYYIHGLYLASFLVLTWSYTRLYFDIWNMLYLFMPYSSIAQHIVDSLSLVCRQHHNLLRRAGRWRDARGSSTGKGGTRMVCWWRRVTSSLPTRESHMGISA